MSPGAEPTRLSALIERDGEACVWCGRELWHADLTVEHVCPRSRGGVTTAENLLVACRSCNRTRGSRAVAAFAREQEERGLWPRCEVLERALEALSVSGRRRHREYGRAQLRHFGFIES